MPAGRKSLAYYATIQHAQWMLGTDSQYLKLIGQRKSLPAAINMFHDYRVARTIWGKNGSEILAQAVLDDMESWPRSLSARAAWCARLARAADRPLDKDGATQQGVPYSAVSKLCWFLHPNGWTMFDKYARLGLSGEKSFADFYEDLEKAKFLAKAKELNGLIKGRSLKGLYGERIIDKFLMLRGNIWSRNSSDAADWCKLLEAKLDHFLANLKGTHKSGRELSKALEALAYAVSEVLPNNSLETSYTKRKLGKRPLS